tara:strand:- start:48 stop:1328 length:1281 start_codon:yes stop_codon:yes gene_type:complete
MALTQVSSKGIKDGTILNEDVNASADIAGSKLADNSITLAKLVHGDSNNNGKFLKANNGADPSFETIDLTALSASNLTSGTLPDARFPSTLPAISGANLTNLDASDLASGTIPDARFPGTLPAVSAANLTNIPAANITGTLPAIDGSNLTGLSGVSVANQADNRLITCTGTTDALNAESYWTISGASLALGTSSPAANIHLRNSYVHLRIDSDGSNNDTNFSMITGTGKNNNINFGDAADDNVGIISYDHNGDQMKFIVGASERMRLDADGLSFNGDTAANNSLDDYEEGTFTLVISDATSGGNSASGVVKQGKYTKIGNTVTVMINASGLSNGGMNGSHQMFITNLPFRMKGVNQTAVFTQLRYFNNISNTQFGTHWQINENETIMRLKKLADNAGEPPNITYNHWMYSSSYFAFACTFSYITDQ